jgi:hypothetical protein
MGMGNTITPQPAGYSGRPLAKKLGIKEGFSVKLINPPAYYFDLFTDLPGNLDFDAADALKKDFIHFFTKQEDEFLSQLPQLKQHLKPNGMVWVSWPKKSSKIATSVTGDLIRNYAISIGLVDIKVCAVDETWSGLKLVIPVKDR